MTEADAVASSDEAARLAELHPALRPRVERLLAELRQLTWQPRILYAYRTPEQQLVLYRAGRSNVQFSFHNATYPDGRPAALAADVIDRRYAWSGAPAANFFENLGRIARSLDLTWGADWDGDGVMDIREAHGTRLNDSAHVQLLPNSALYRVARGWLPPEPAAA